MSTDSPFERPAQEKRPEFSPDEPIAERLVRLFMNLTTELAVVRERLDTVEHLLAEKGQVTAADIENYVPDGDTEAQRRAWREAYIQRVFADLQAEVDHAIAEAGQSADAFGAGKR
ncbi:MAG: hypothetical protein QNJ73_06325 [Gammaproteobacteria bacterium]|nr:hypothetical protein [Gammaproteobacteria bacterium]